MRRLPRPLGEVEIRVLGSLLEKEQATPAYYPMTLNSVTQACNQKSNRSPVMDLSGSEVQAALDSLFSQDVFVWRSRAGRTTKWSHNVDRRWQMRPASKAVMTLLLLRGPQTIGALRSRSDRRHAFTDLSAVEQALESLSSGEDPLVRELARQPGQKESRWTHLVGDGASVAPTIPEMAAPSSGGKDRLARLEARVAELERLVAGFSPESSRRRR